MADVKGTVKVDGVEFSYNEVKPASGGAGPRGINVSGGGSAQIQFYPITPNPHTELGATYVADAPAFYKEAATHITKGFKKPEATAFKKLGAGERPPAIKGPDWMKLDKNKQKTAVDNYNSAEATKVDAANKKALKTEVEAHLKGKKGTSFSWKTKSWKLP